MNKRRMLFLLIFLQFWLAPTVFPDNLEAKTATKIATECERQMTFLSATYEIQSQVAEKSKTSTDKLEIYRLGDTIIYRYPNRAISEIWHKTPNKQLKPTHLFDKFEKGIEYQPSDFNQEFATVRWQNKFQLLTDKFLTSLNHTKIYSSKRLSQGKWSNTSKCNQLDFLQVVTKLHKLSG